MCQRNILLYPRIFKTIQNIFFLGKNIKITDLNTISDGRNYKYFIFCI